MTHDADVDHDAPSRRTDLRSQLRPVLTLLASAVRLIAILFAAVLVVHIILTVSGANPANAFRRFIEGLANGLTLGLGDLFVGQVESLQVVLNYGVPAIVWLAVGLIVGRLLRSVA